MCWMNYLILTFWFWGLVYCGPQTRPHQDITDQELFWGADQYDFSVVLFAAGTECFWHFAHHGERFYLSFMQVNVQKSDEYCEESLSCSLRKLPKPCPDACSIIQVQWVTGVGQDRHLSVTVNSPSGLLVSTVDDAKGQINLEVKETGFYQMCLSNFHNRFSTMQVFLSFGVYYEDYRDLSKSKEEEKKKKEEVSKDLNNTLSIIETATNIVENRVFHMFRYYSFSRMRKSADYFLLRSNSQYITWWSTALSLLIITSGYLQLLFLRSLFVSRPCMEDEKPRC